MLVWAADCQGTGPHPLHLCDKCVIDTQVDDNLRLAARNILGAQVMNTISVTSYDVLRHRYVIMTKDAAAALTLRLTQRVTSPIDHKTRQNQELYAQRLARHQVQLANLRAAAAVPIQKTTA